MEYRVTDSAGNTSYLQTSLEVYDPRDYQIDVELTSYLVYTPLNTPLDVGAYYAGADWTNEVALNIESDLDTSRPGCYYADFNVSDGYLQREEPPDYCCFLEGRNRNHGE